MYEKINLLCYQIAAEEMLNDFAKLLPGLTPDLNVRCSRRQYFMLPKCYYRRRPNVILFKL